MIKSFCGKGTELVFNEQFSRKLPKEMQQRALRKLQMLDAAGDLKDLKIPPANQLEALKGDRVGQWSNRINRQWRICFRWEAGLAHDVAIVDYH